MAISLVMTSDDLKDMNKATFDAFIQSGNYALSKTEAYKQFGKVHIDTLITNKLLKDSSELPGKCKFLLSDIIAATKAWEKM